MALVFKNADKHNKQISSFFRAIQEIKTSLLFPLFQWLMYAAVLVWFLGVAFFLMSSRTILFKVKDLQNDSDCICDNDYMVSNGISFWIARSDKYHEIHNGSITWTAIGFSGWRLVYCVEMGKALHDQPNPCSVQTSQMRLQPQRDTGLHVRTSAIQLFRLVLAVEFRDGLLSNGVGYRIRLVVLDVLQKGRAVLFTNPIRLQNDQVHAFIYIDVIKPIFPYTYIYFFF